MNKNKQIKIQYIKQPSFVVYNSNHKLFRKNNLLNSFSFVKLCHTEGYM